MNVWNICGFENKIEINNKWVKFLLCFGYILLVRKKNLLWWFFVVVLNNYVYSKMIFI